MQFFQDKHGIDKSRVFALLMRVQGKPVKGLEDIDLDGLELLHEFATALKEQQIAAEEMFKAPGDPDQKPGESKTESIARKLKGTGGESRVSEASTGFIDVNQQHTLRKLATAYGVSDEDFLKMVKDVAGVETLDTVPTDKIDAIMEALSKTMGSKGAPKAKTGKPKQGELESNP